MADLYRRLPQEAVAEARAAPDTSATLDTDAAVLSALSPLPMIMDFGAGPVAIGIEVPYSLADAIQAQLIRDDEEALLAILIAAQY